MPLHELRNRDPNVPSMVVAGNYGVEDTLSDLVEPAPIPERTSRPESTTRSLGNMSIGELARAYDDGLVSPDRNVNYVMAIAHTRALGTGA